jgi:hypothetical protein
MSWNYFVSGGVAPPRAVLATTQAVMPSAVMVDLPETGSAGMQEAFEEVVLNEDQTMSGSQRHLTAGFRYRIKIHYPYLNLADYRKLVQIITYSNNRGGFYFLPHSDGEWQFRVAACSGCNFNYVGGKYLGYEGTLELVGLDLLRSIPIDSEVGWSDFCHPDYIYLDSDEGLHQFAVTGFPGDFEPYRSGDDPGGWSEFGSGGSAVIARVDGRKAYRFTQSTGIRGSIAGRDLDDVELELDFCGNTLDDSDGGILLRFVDANNHYRICLDIAGDTVKVQKMLGGELTDLATYTDLGLLPQRWFTLKVVLVSNVVAIFIRPSGAEEWDFRPCGSPVTDTSFPEGKVGLFASHGTFDFRDIRLRTSDKSDPYYLPTDITHLAHYCPEKLTGAVAELCVS